MKKNLWFSCLLLLSLLSSTRAFAGAWTLARGRLWIKTALLVQNTGQRYASENIFCGDQICQNGQRTDYFFNGRVESNAVYLDIWYGLTNRFEVQLQIPYFDIGFSDDINPDRPRTTDFGDIRLGLRYRLPLKPVVTTLRLGAKAPTGFFNKDAETVPVGDGQWDLELASEFGYSLWPAPAYANLLLEYRVRFEPNIEVTNLVPGDEFALRAEIGYSPLKQLWLVSAIDGFWGQEFRSISEGSELSLKNSERQIFYFEPKIIWSFARSFALETALSISLAGKNYPAGLIFNIGLSYGLQF